MFRNISRRDFIGGVAVGIGSAGWLAGCAPGETPLPPDPGFERAAGYYPPGLTGLRGDHEGSFESAHILKDGGLSIADAIDARESYDLVVVGGGISGLAAAHYFRQKAGPSAKVLVLDNHDDFGGHAKRNEFAHNGRTYIGYGGTQSIDSPAPYSATAKGLLTDLGVDVSSYERVLDGTLYKSFGLSGGMFFDKETFGADKLVVGTSRNASKEFLAQSPLPASDSSADRSPEHREARCDARPVVRGEEGQARADELHRLRDEGVEARPEGAGHLPDAHVRPVWLRRGRGAGAGRMGARTPGVPGHAPRARNRPRTELRLDSQRRSRELLLPLPRRQRLDRAPARAPPDPRSRARQDGGRHRHGACRLRQAR